MIIKGFFHNDLDGVSSAMICRSVLIGLQYGFYSNKNIESSIAKFIEKDKNTAIFIADFFLSPELMKKLNDRGNVLYFDHHLDSASYVEKYYWCRYANNMCAAYILYNYFYDYANLYNITNKDNFKDKWEFFMIAVNEYDLYLWKETNNINSYKLNKLLYALGFDYFMNRFLINTSLEFEKAEILILKAEEKKLEMYIKSTMKNLHKIKINNLNGLMVYAENYPDEITEHILNNYNEDFLAIISMKSARVSLRSLKSNINVKNIAQSFGGNGHVAAAGFPINNLNELTNMIFTNNISKGGEKTA